MNDDNLFIYALGLVWSWCKGPFLGDCLRWYCAWTGLLRKGWVIRLNDNNGTSGANSYSNSGWGVGRSSRDVVAGRNCQ